jgi:hypothetical protein
MSVARHVYKSRRRVLSSTDLLADTKYPYNTSGKRPDLPKPSLYSSFDLPSCSGPTSLDQVAMPLHCCFGCSQLIVWLSCCFGRATSSRAGLGSPLTLASIWRQHLSPAPHIVCDSREAAVPKAATSSRAELGQESSEPSPILQAQSGAVSPRGVHREAAKTSLRRRIGRSVQEHRREVFVRPHTALLI